QQLLGLSGFPPCATAAAEEPFWGLMHSTAGGAKPREDLAMVHGPIPTEGQARGRQERERRLLSMRACSRGKKPGEGFPGARRECARADTHLHKQYASLLPSKLHKQGGGGNIRSQRLEQRRPTELRFKASLSCRREQHLCLSARLPPRIPVKALKPELCGELIAGPRNQELNDTKKESGERKLREREKGGKSVQEQEDSFLLTHSDNPAALHPRFQVNEPLRSRPRVWEPGLGCECNAAKVALSTLSVSLFFSDPAMTAKCSKT
ncbi:hypothetical protein KUCAC02_020310, partial [Chaenocephalus aceratus]